MCRFEFEMDEYQIPFERVRIKCKNVSGSEGAAPVQNKYPTA